MNTDAMPVTQRLAGWSLRHHREKAGYSLSDAARILDCHPSKISRMECGQRGIRPKELRELMAEYGADAAVEEALAELARQPRGNARWWTEYERQLAPSYVELLSAEASASAVAAWGPMQVPELLQTPGYARVIAAADPSVPKDFEAATVTATLDRQRVTLSERGLPVTVVIGEAALRQRAGGPTVMRAQISHLADLADQCPNITIRLLPFITGALPAGGAGGFTVLQFGAVAAFCLVHLDGPSGGLCPDSPEAADGYLRVYAHLQALALSPEHTARRLWELARTQ
jgi:transcriptional regulator with XRE-family HTH domain